MYHEEECMGYDDIDVWDGIYTNRVQAAQAAVEVEVEISDEELAYLIKQDEEMWAVWDAAAQGG